MVVVILVAGLHPERAVVAPEIEPFRVVRRAIFDGLAETPVGHFATPFAHGFERDDLPVNTGSGSNAVFVKALAVIGIPDFADERARESCFGSFALELADQAAVGFRWIFGGRRPEYLFDSVPVAESEPSPSFADSYDAANVLIAVVKQAPTPSLILDVQRIRCFGIAEILFCFVHVISN